MALTLVPNTDFDGKEYDDAFDPEAFEQAMEEQRKKNETYLDEFEAELRSSGLSDKTIERHVSNAQFYLNTYLMRDEPFGVEQGCYRVDDFLGYFFIRKCAWSTPKTIKQYATSLKKFYKCMLAAGHVTQGDVDELFDTIKEMMPTWLEDCEEFNTPSDDLFPGGFDADLFGKAYDAVARALGLDELLGVGGAGTGNADDDPYGEDDDDYLSKDEAINVLTLALAYLTSREEKDAAGGERVLRAPRTLDLGTADFLCDNKFADDTDDSDTVTLTPAGINAAVECVESLGLGYLIEGE